MKNALLLLTTLLSAVAAHADPLRVLIWDERQPRQSEAYENFLGNEIAAQLRATAPERSRSRATPMPPAAAPRSGR